MDEVFSLLEYDEIPSFSDSHMDIESYYFKVKFEISIKIEGSAGYYTSDNQVDITLSEAIALKKFIDRSIEEYEKIKDRHG